MDLYVLNSDLEILDIIDTYKSIIWTNRYYDSGDFELYLPASEKMIDLLKIDRFIVRADDLTNCMIIENITITTDVEEGNYIITTGRSLSSILSRRIIYNQTTVNGTVEAGIRKLINENAINPTRTQRKFNKLILGSELGISEEMTAQYTGDNLEEVIKSLCKSYNLGYDILLNLDEKQFIFVLYEGVNRTYNQTEVPAIIFSNEFENLLTTEYVKNTENYKNYIVVAGEGEGNARKKASITTGTMYTDLSLREYYVDARDISSNNGEISAADYIKLLVERGEEKLNELTVIENINGEVEANHTYKVNEDYFLGDLVEIETEYGITAQARITEIIQSEDDSGVYVIPTFNYDE